jgi:hypothetical protein
VSCAAVVVDTNQSIAAVEAWAEDFLSQCDQSTVFELIMVCINECVFAVTDEMMFNINNTSCLESEHYGMETASRQFMQAGCQYDKR